MSRIGPEPTSRDVRHLVATEGKADIPEGPTLSQLETLSGY
jgi:hypothetical protein